MIILKCDREYAVEERRTHWVVSRKAGALSMTYEVPKDICVDENALRTYVEKENLF